jgi:hypothetical protein
MDLMRARVALRERALLDVLDLAVRFCGAHARAYAALALVVLGPMFVASWAVARLGGWVLGWMAALALAAFADVPFLVLASRLLFEEKAPMGAVLGQSLAALPRVAAVRLLALLGLAVSTLLLGLPWLWFGSILLFSVEVVVLERARVVDACRRAHRLATAHLGTVLTALILLDLLMIGGPLVADVAGRELLERVLEIRPPRPLWEEGGNFLALLGWWATVPLLATARFLQYIDCRTRSEGWDIQTRFAAIAARATLAVEERRLDAGGPL